MSSGVAQRSARRSARDKATLAYLWAEFYALFVGMPFLLCLVRRHISGLVVPTILVMALLCLVLLLRDSSFDRRRLGHLGPLWPPLRRVLFIFVPSGIALTAAVWFLLPERFLHLPTVNPRLYATVMVFYPLLSVYPQEIIFRAFLFHRYRRLFPGVFSRVTISALAFGLAHVFFSNWIAPLLSTLGGFLFARTYARSGSLAACSVEHGLWGDLLFTIGLGWFFYGGSVVVRLNGG